MDGNNEGAMFSNCRNYRYSLWRIWDYSKPIVMLIGLNPSTANEITNDPTIRRLYKLVYNNGYGGFFMMNLFAWISPYPDSLVTVDDPVGENDKWLKVVAGRCHDVCFCWGNFKQATERAEHIKGMFKSALCFDQNKNGSPKHPLYLPAETKMKIFAETQNQQP